MREQDILNSVCMATFNGAAYVEQQLESILSQLGEDDEIVLVDDHSSDATMEIVAAFGDSRIKVYRNEKNLGVARTFEKALGLARGELIWLADQDDIWHPQKVSKMVEVFARRPEVTLVLSDARIVDQTGRVMVESFFRRRGGFCAGIVHNLLKNKYLGCVMAFRRGLLDKALPFPADIPQHDMWLGLVNARYGQAEFLDRTLVDYRMHGGNASGTSSNKRGTVVQMIIWRWRLMKNLYILGSRL